MILYKEKMLVSTIGVTAVVLCLTILLEVAGRASQESPRMDQAYRISGIYEAGRVVSLDILPLRVRLPLTITDRIFTNSQLAAGYFLEILDGDAKALLRLGIDDPTYVLMEYEEPEKPGHIINKEIHVDKIEFSILIPAPTGGKEIRFRQVKPGQMNVPAGKRMLNDLGSFILPANGKGRAVPINQGGAS